MELEELVARLQELAHEGWAETEVNFWTERTGILFPEEEEIRLDSDAMINVFVGGICFIFGAVWGFWVLMKNILEEIKNITSTRN